MPDLFIEPIGWGRRIGQTLIDVIVFLLVWNLVLSITNVRFPFGVMQKFSQSDYDAYVKIMSWMTLSLFTLSIVLHRLFGGSIGKLLMLHRTVQVSGAAMTFRQSSLRSAAMFLLGIAILAPGPLIAFIFGKGSESASILALTLGLITWLAITLPWTTGHSALETWLGLATVRTADLRSANSSQN
jgi:RDD family